MLYDVMVFLLTLTLAVLGWVMVVAAYKVTFSSNHRYQKIQRESDGLLKTALGNIHRTSKSSVYVSKRGIAYKISRDGSIHFLNQSSITKEALTDTTHK